MNRKDWVNIERKARVYVTLGTDVELLGNEKSVTLKRSHNNHKTGGLIGDFVTFTYALWFFSWH